ncbi:MAG: hypothetical protein KatS3mg024_1492 [Armatimonadota bacterium]|nr:MAG: hypothetical protein KatS3mg024_1492 [Armatimonadota bacterium]
MRIVQVNLATEFYSPFDGGAVARVIREQAAIIQSKGHFVTVVTVPSPSGNYDTGHVLPVRNAYRDELSFAKRAIFKLKGWWLKWDIPYYDVFIRSVIARIESLTHPPDVIITHNDLVAPRYLKARFPSSTIAAMLHNIQNPSLKDAKALAAPVDMFLTVSDYLKDWVLTHLGLPREKVATVSHGVNLQDFYPRPDWASRHAGPLRVLVVARIEPNKGQDLVARAVARLAKEGIPVKLTLAGPVWMFGSQARETSSYLEEVLAAAHPAQCEHLGHVPHPQMRSLYQQHDVVCLISRLEEGFGLAILEAMACGCAAVSSDRGGLKEATRGAALVVEPDDPDTIFRALRRLATDEQELRRWKEKSLERAKEASWEVSVDRMLRLFRELRSGKPTPQECIA